MDPFVSSPYTIAIGSLDEYGNYPGYSENCAPMLASAIGGSTLSKQLVSTGQNGECTPFKGTSASCPIAAGVFALVLEKFPHITWRTLQHLIVETSDHQFNNDSFETLPGRYFSHKQGYGLINSEKLFRAAFRRKNVGKRISVEAFATYSNGFWQFNVQNWQIKCVEHVMVKFSLPNVVRGSVSVNLTSPTGITSNLLVKRPNDTSIGFLDNEFYSAAHWGQKYSGLWRLKIDYASDLPLQNLKLTIFGETWN